MTGGGSQPMGAPVVTVVIPCYNQAGYLRQAIDSVLAQDYAPLELLLIDDGSTDGTLELMQEYRDRCAVTTQANAGQSNAINFGWARARGEVLAYLSADDYLLPGAVARSVAWLQQNPDAVLCYCDYLLVDPASRFIRRVRTPEYSRRELVLRLVCAPGPGAFLRRRAVERAGPWNERLRQIPDFDLFLRLAADGRFGRIPEVLAAYRVHDASQSFAPVSAERAAELIEVMEAHFRAGGLPRELSDAKDEALSNARILSARFHLRSGRVAAALRLLSDAFMLCPGNFLRLRAWHVIANGLVNRIAHRVLWLFRR